MSERVTPSMLACIKGLLHHSYMPEVQERSPGMYGIVLPIDGNYAQLEDALYFLKHAEKQILWLAEQFDKQPKYLYSEEMKVWFGADDE